MSIQTFSRYEQKYLVTDAQKRAFLDLLAGRLRYDDHSGADRSYQVFNVYYDTPDNEVVRQSLDKPNYKEKLRLRSYRLPVLPDDPVFLEIKKKIVGKVNKRRIVLPYREAVAFVAEGREPVFADYLNGQVGAEIGWFLENHRVLPHCFIRYDRVALYAASDPRIRITFDADIRVRTDNVSLADGSGEPLLDDGIWLMEIKTVDNYPLWLADALNGIGLRRRSFSKYSAAYAVRKTGAWIHAL